MPLLTPLGWEGDSAAYMVLMRSRYTDLMHGQRMIFTSSFSWERGHMEVFGPYAEEATRIIEAMHNKPKALKASAIFKPSGGEDPLRGVIAPPIFGER